MAVIYKPAYDPIAQTAQLEIVINAVPETAYSYAAGEVTASARPNPAVLLPAEFSVGVRGIHEFLRIVRQFAPAPSFNLNVPIVSQPRPPLRRLMVDRDRKANGDVTLHTVIGQGADRIDVTFSYIVGAGTITSGVRGAFTVTLPEFQMWLLALDDFLWVVTGQPMLGL